MNHLRMNQPIIGYGVILLFCCVSSLLGNTHVLFSEAPDALSAADGQTMVPPPANPAWRQSRPVRLSSAVRTGEGLAEGDQLVFTLSEDQSFTADIDRISRNINGTLSVRGRIAEYPLGTVLISTTDGRTLATIDIPELNQQWVLQDGTETAVSFLAEVDAGRADVLEDSPPRIPPTRSDVQSDIPPPADPTAPVTIDLLIVYTPAARSWASGSGGIQNLISQAMEKGQLALDNSQTYLTVRLVHSEEISYTESGDSGTDLDRLTNAGDGYMDSVDQLRNRYKADLVCLYAAVDDTGGLSWLLSDSGGEPWYGFSLVRVQQVGFTYTVIHELGHNMGCGHHKAQTTQPGPGLFSYSAGWRWTGTDGQRYCSVMTYERGTYFADGLDHTAVPYFSNPAISYKGLPTGHVTNGDNARTIREVKQAIADYRYNTSPSMPTILTPTAAEQGVSLTPTLTASKFYDADGDGHANSHWQIARDSGFAQMLWNSQETWPAGESVTIPSGFLLAKTTYFCRVRYKDSSGEWSNWSPTRSFTTRFFYASGNGSQSDPYQISTVADWKILTQTSEDWSAFFILTADLDMTGVALSPVAGDTSSSETGFQGTAFTGDFNGNAHIIRNARIQSATLDYVGLFGNIGAEGQVRNLGIQSVMLQGRKNVGGLAGWNERGTITSCFVTGTVVGENSVGGLVGGNWIGTILNCSSEASVTGTQYVGGLVGGNQYFGEMTFCFASGLVRGSSLVGGLMGWNFRGSITGCFWDRQTTGQTSSAEGTGLTTADMKTRGTFTDAGWDFVGESANGMTDMWRMCADGTRYPWLSWRFARTGDFACPEGVALEDLVYLAGRWTADTPAAAGTADANGDSKVNLADFGVLAQNWMR